jgi:membrane-associated phospholipid phosphatase
MPPPPLSLKAPSADLPPTPQVSFPSSHTLSLLLLLVLLLLLLYLFFLQDGAN